METKRIDKSKIVIGVLLLAVCIMSMAVVYLTCFNGSQQQVLSNDKGLSLVDNAIIWVK